MLENSPVRVVDIYYGDEFIATGYKKRSPWSFWTFIAPDMRVLDYERVVSRLREIERTDGVRFEVGFETIGFPPAYTVKYHEGVWP